MAEFPGHLNNRTAGGLTSNARADPVELESGYASRAFRDRANRVSFEPQLGAAVVEIESRYSPGLPARAAMLVAIVPGGFGPGLFAAGVAAAVVAGAGAIVMGVLTLQTRNECVGLFQDDPHAAEVANRGMTYRAATNVLLAVTAVFGAATVVVLSRTRFGTAASTVDVAGIVLPDAAMGSIGVRF